MGSMEEKEKLIGKVGWIDLTVTEAAGIKDFYSKVTGWKAENFSMGTYDDYVMNMPFSGQPIAGICNKRGGNSDFPAQWLIYIYVEDLTKSIELCLESGGKLLAGPKTMTGQGKYCVIEDPAGAVCALFEQEIAV
jgi:uncharacterized protein